MIIETFQNEQDYIRYVRNILIFTHLRAYNAQSQIWKDEDISFISNVDNDKLRDSNPELYKESLAVYFRAQKEYGHAVQTWRDNFTSLTPEEVLYNFGFEYTAEEYDDEYIACDLDINLASLNKTENYPTSFPVIVILSDGDFKVERIYLEDFEKSAKIEDFSWLEENVKAFWRGDKGSCWGA